MLLGVAGSVATAEGRMCGLVSCFTAGTQVVAGEEIIASAYGIHEAVQVGEIVFDNIFKNGIARHLWDQAFIVVRPYKLTIEVIGEF
ncbi:MAG: hypothetical protein LBQ50_05075 [Planctomycetaceae bacterium]|nr:hypothetical protein [Planctomycetaceae bacterium]